MLPLCSAHFRLVYSEASALTFIFLYLRLCIIDESVLSILSTQISALPQTLALDMNSDLDGWLSLLVMQIPIMKLYRRQNLRSRVQQLSRCHPVKLRASQ